jgi:hypothetical protein
MPIGLTSTVEALAKRVNPSNLALCTRFRALFNAAQRFGTARATQPALLNGFLDPAMLAALQPAPLHVIRNTGIGNLLAGSYIVVVKGADADTSLHL